MVTIVWLPVLVVARRTRRMRGSVSIVELIFVLDELLLKDVWNAGERVHETSVLGFLMEEQYLGCSSGQSSFFGDYQASWVGTLRSGLSQ